MAGKGGRVEKGEGLFTIGAEEDGGKGREGGGFGRFFLVAKDLCTGMHDVYYGH